VLFRSVEPAAAGSSFDIAGSQYAFRIAEFVPSGRLEERYEPAERGVSALAVEIVDGVNAGETVWLELGKARTIPFGSGAVTLSFGPMTPDRGAHP